MRKRKNIFASLDLGAEEIRLMIVHKGFKGLKILVNEVFRHNDLPLLSQRLEEYGPKEVIMLLPKERVLVRDVTLPPADKGRIRSMLYFELSGSIPYSMEQIHLDYILVKKTKKAVKVKAFIIPELLQREVESLRNAGIGITRLIPRGLAVAGYLNKNQENRLIKYTTSQGDLVIFPQIEHYFSRLYYPGQVVDEEELRNHLSREGITPERWDLLEIAQPEIDLLGGIQFYVRYPAFNLLTERVIQRSYNYAMIGIIALLIGIIVVNTGTFYLDYLMKQKELLVYQERLENLIPRTERIKELTAKTNVLAGEYEELQEVYLANTDYLIWLRQLHFLLQEDTEVNILVLEDNFLRELHGVSSSAVGVTDRLQKSVYFTKAEFTAPITSKEVEGEEVEEFSITAVLENPTTKGGLADE